MAKKKSFVWKHFTINKEKTICECNRCGKQLKYCRSTTNLVNHLDIHGITFDCESTATDAESNEQITIPEIVNTMKECSEGGTLNRKFVNDLASMIACCGFSFNMVELTPFRMFFNKQLPRFKLPSRGCLKSAIMQKYERVRGAITMELALVDNFAITFDSWTDPFNTQCYLGLTLHFVKEDDLRCQVIAVRAFKETHTAINIATMIENILNEWNIKKESIICCVTDNAANVKLATDTLLGSNHHVPCFAHTLNLCVKDILVASRVFHDLVVKIKEIVTFFKQSSKAAQLLKQSQADEQKVLKLKQSCPTRWNSVYLMLERYIDIHIHVHMTLIQCNGAPSILTLDEIQIIGESLELLKPFYQATEELSSESKTTISKVIPMVNLMRKNVTLVPVTLELVKELKEKTLKILDDRFGNIEKSKFHAIATLLDPRFKRNDFTDIVCSTSAVSHVNKLVKDLGPGKPVENVEYSGLWSTRVVRSSDLSATLSLDESLRLYLNSPLSPLDQCPLTIWSSLKQLNHNIAKLALQFLIIPATSVPSERVFSKAGKIITRFRSSLDPKLAEELVILASQDPTLVYES